nr:GntR family transcriptional regulator [uncultured Devosia sp.]
MANALHTELASKILIHVRSNGMESGRHLTEAELVDLLGVSRPPIRSALAHLAEAGILRKEPNRGYFVQDASGELANAEDDLYLLIADARFDNTLPELVSESELMRRFETTRSSLQRTLVRIAQEGWIERREGRGWQFLSMIDTVEAMQESHDLLKIVEPMGLLAPTFRKDPLVTARLRQQQQYVLEEGQRLGRLELFETTIRYHVGLAAMSNNRFLAGTVERQRKLGRLIEYRLNLNATMIEAQSTGRLAILDLVDGDHNLKAADTLSQLIDKARDDAVRTTAFA